MSIVVLAVLHLVDEVHRVLHILLGRAVDEGAHADEDR